MLTKKATDSYIGPDEWIRRAPSQEGSWWTEWIRFLTLHSGQPVAPLAPVSTEQNGASLSEAPGSYVLEQ